MTTLYEANDHILLCADYHNPLQHRHMAAHIILSMGHPMLVSAMEYIRKNAVILGEYGCRGYNTYGPWKLIGGMNKHHPTEQELEDAVLFFKSINP